MSRDQRTDDNWALLYAQEQALLRHSPLQVLFSLVPSFLSAHPRQYLFMLKGLREVAGELTKKNINFVLLSGDPSETVPRYLQENSISLLITDFDPLRIKREWKKAILEKTSVPVHEVDAHNVIPCWEVSSHQEYGAYTLRPKVHKMINDYMEPFPLLKTHPYEIDSIAGTPPWNELEKTHGRDSRDQRAPTPPGQSMALRKLRIFIEKKLASYDETRNDPSLNGQSNLSPYIHFGQLSAQRILLDVSDSNAIKTAQDIFLEELIVRRELADNFCYYNQNYDNLKGFPAWSQETLEKHLHDVRPYLYDRDSLESAMTHDPAWNAAQHQLVSGGIMHGYMRMYWAKKILEWSTDPGTAMKTAIYLNDHYSLDGRDPNGYTGIAWSMGGIHDRAWGERPIFGKIRYMNYAGLQRKFKISSYIETYGGTSTGVSALPL
jgi:deoxyribodipyrimidine photo-lyase